MYYQWLSYNKQKHQEIDEWYKVNDNITTFAFYHEPFSKQVKWYQDHPDDVISNIRDAIYVIGKEHQIIACMICNISATEESVSASINPIVINPEYLHQGHAKHIIQELMDRKDILLDPRVQSLKAMVDARNGASLSLFQSLGFKRGILQEGYYEFQKQL